VGSAALWDLMTCAAVGSQVRMRRAFLVEADARAQLRESRQTKLESVDVSSVRWLWAALNGRLDKHLAQTMPPPLLALMRQEAEMEVRSHCDLRAISLRSPRPLADRDRRSIRRSWPLMGAQYDADARAGSTLAPYDAPSYAPSCAVRSTRPVLRARRRASGGRLTEGSRLSAVCVGALALRARGDAAAHGAPDDGD
jgi:hypothetical protein